MAVKKQETEAAVQAAPEKDTEVIRLYRRRLLRCCATAKRWTARQWQRSWRRKALLCSRRSACKAEEHSSCKEKSILQNENRHPVQRHMAVPGVFAAEATAGCGRKNAGSRDLRSRS